MTEAIAAYPLQWPAAWPRTPIGSRASARFSTAERRLRTEFGGRQTSYQQRKPMAVGAALTRVRTELQRLGVNDADVVISSNVPLRLDGLPRSGAAEPSDSGVAVYWRSPGSRNTRCMAIDRYSRVADNLAAVAATLDAMRAIQRHGGAQILDRAFTGFTALPPPAQGLPQDWWAVLECSPDAPLSEIGQRYRRLAAAAHPDRPGGSHDRMAAINQAWQAARNARLEATR